MIRLTSSYPTTIFNSFLSSRSHPLTINHIRSFFNRSLPKLDDINPPHGHSQRGDLLIYKETKAFPYSKQELYRVIADVETYPEFVPYCLGSNLLSSHPSPTIDHLKPWVKSQKDDLGELHTLSSELVIGFKAFQERYTSQVECRKWDMVKASASQSSLFKSLDSTWTFHSPQEILNSKSQPDPLSTSSSSTTSTPMGYASLLLAFAFASPLHAAIGEMFWKTISEEMVKAFEKRLFQVYGHRPMPLKSSNHPTTY